MIDMSSLSPFQIKDRLLKVMKDDGSVRDLKAALEIITMLENTKITKTELEDTRIGKYINDIRKAAKDQVIQKRAKKLIKMWQKMFKVAEQQPAERTVQHTTPAKRQSPLPAPPSNKHRRHALATPTQRTNSPSTVNGDARDHKRRSVDPAPPPSGGVKLQTDAKFTKSALYMKSKRSRPTTPKKSPEERPSVPSPRQQQHTMHLPKADGTSPPLTANLTCKKNGLKLKITSLPPSPTKEYATTWPDPDIPKSRHKRRRDEDMSPPDSLDSTRTNEEMASSSMTSSTLSPLSQGASAYRHEPDLPPPPSSGDLPSKHLPPSVAASTITESDGPVAVTRRCVSNPRDRGRANEWAGVDGCRGGNGAWYAWYDSIYVKRPQAVSIDAPSELDALSILPYVELE